MSFHLFGSFRGAAECPGNGMLRAVLQGRHQGQALVAVEPVQWAYGAEGEATFGQGASLVEYHRVDVLEAFQYVAAGQQQAELVQGSRSGGQGGRRSQRQGAGAGGDEHGQDYPEGAGRVVLPPVQTHHGCQQ
ncbi:hypothetical protein D3C78_681290 [compost metagenome]